MKRYIWKFPLIPALRGDEITIQMPKGAVALTAAFQGEELMVWATVDPDLPPVSHTFLVVPTGGQGYETSGASYLSIAFHPDRLVFHVFDCGEPPA